MKKITSTIIAVLLLAPLGFESSPAQAATVNVFQTSTNPVTNGLVAQYTFDGKDVNWATNTVTDRAGGNTGSLINFATSTGAGSGKIGQALNFGGTTYVDAGNGANFNFTNGSSVTMCAWLYGTSGSLPSPTYQAVMSKRDDSLATLYAYGINFVTGNFQVYSSNGIRSFAYNLPARQWTHICGILSNPTSLYVNGTLFGTSTASSAASNTATFHIGVSSPATSAYETFRGKIDDVRLYNRALSASEIAQIYNAGVAKVKTPNKSSLVAHWSFNEGAGALAHDFSGNGNSATLANSPAWINGKLGSAVSFDGSTQYGTANALTNLAFSSGTVSWWMNPSSAYNSGAVRGMWGQSTTTAPEFSCQIFVDNNWYCGWNTGGAGDTRVKIAATPTNYPQGTWAYYTLSWTPSGTNLYQNGILIGTNATAPSVTNIGQPFQFARQGGTSNRFPGALDDMRIYSRALSASEIAYQYRTGAAIHNRSTNSLLGNGLVGLWSFDGKDMNWAANQAYDRSGNGNTGFLSNLGTTTAPAFGKIGQALKFNGVSSVVNVANSSSLNFGSGDFSISVWYYNGKNVTANDNVLGKGAGFNANAIGFGLRSRNSGTQVEFCVNGGSGTCPRITGSTLTNSWNHVVAVVSRSSTLSSLYINGALWGTMAWAPTYTDTFGLTIGQGENDYFPDKIDDVRLYNRALSASEVKQLYNQGK